MKRQGDRERRVSRILIVGYASVGALIAAAAWLGIARIEREIETVSDFHARSYSSLRQIEGMTANGAQELYAYLFFGHEEELADFRAVVPRVDAESARYASLAKLSEPDRQREFELLSEIRARWSDYLRSAEHMITEHQTTGVVTEATYVVSEELLDDLSELFSQLIAIESEKVAGARVRRDEIINESERLFGAVALVGLFAIFGVGFLVTRRVAFYVTELEQRDEDIELGRAALESTQVGICYTDAQHDNAIIFANEAVCEITGYSEEEMLGKSLRMMQGDETDPADIEAIRTAMSEERGFNRVVVSHRKSGEPFWNDIFLSPVHDASGTLTHYVAAMHDVTERQSLELRLAQSQKMEAVGQLAGGVAHDFNNYLTVINGYAEVLATDLPDEESREQARQIIEAGTRSATLIRQLLAFSRRQVMIPQVLDLNRVLLELDPLLRRTLGDEISLETVTAGGLDLVSADRSQIEQVLLNLVVNARDAMPDGGCITIETGNVFLDSDYAARVGNAQEGRHVMIAVSDTGAGIPPELRERIFEPFFSTKASTSSGLGLSTVSGIVQQSGGTVQLYSEEGSGTTFKVYLPRVGGRPVSRQQSEPESPLAMAGTVLVVEDQAMVRQFTCEMLRSLGMSVVEAENGRQGLEIIKSSGTRFDALLTDVMMPGMGGRELGEEAKRLLPRLAVLYMSGYTENGILHHGRLDEGIHLLEKPFTRQELRRKLSQVLAESGA